MRAFPRVLAVVLLLVPTIGSTTTWHIEPDGSGDAPTIQAGIDSAAVGDTVLLHDGTYTGVGNKNLNPGGKAITIRSENGAETTIINCENSGRGFYLHSGEQETTILQGLTIRDGNADYGGGIRVNMSGPLVKECFILNCVAVEGGGVHVYPPWVGDRFTLRDCIISGNQAITGGGIMVDGQGGTAYVESTVISGNVSTGGGSGGGGICTGTSGASVTVKWCTISGNYAAGSGGGAFIQDNIGGFSTFDSAILWGNCATLGGEIFADGLSYLLHCCLDTTGVVGSFTPDLWITSDPLFCDPGDCLEAPSTAGDYTLDAASLCLPENDPWGWEMSIGALGQGCDVVTTVADYEALPSRMLSLVATPNPFVGEVGLSYQLPQGKQSTIHVYDIRGRVVRSMQAAQPTGILTWDGTNTTGHRVAPGVYFVRLSDGKSTETKRVTLVR